MIMPQVGACLILSSYPQSQVDNVDNFFYNGDKGIRAGTARARKACR